MKHKEQIEERLILVFGEENVDHKEEGGCIIRFPEIDITNGTIEHTIYDLFIKIGWNYITAGEYAGNVGSFSNTFEGIRTTYAPAELHANYSHSHLRSVPYNMQDDGVKLFKPRWDNFCQGSDVFSTVLSGLNMNFKIEQFFILLNQIDDFVRWESQEGGPHKHLHNLQLGGAQLDEITAEDSIDFNIYRVSKEVHKHLLATGALIEEPYLIGSEDIKFVNEDLVFEKLETILTLLQVTHENRLFHENLIAFKYLNKYYTHRTNMSADLYQVAEQTKFSSNASRLIFKGEEVEYKKLPVPEQTNEFNQKVVNEGIKVPFPAITASVLSNITYRLYSYLNNTSLWQPQKPQVRELLDL